jgi:hypothetical protein
LLIALATLLTASAVNAEEIATEGMVIKVKATVSPSVLPRTEPVPVMVKISGSLRTRNGHEQTRLTWMQLSLNLNPPIHPHG